MARLSAADLAAAVELAGLYRAAARTTTSREADRVACEIAGLEAGIRAYRGSAHVFVIQDEAQRVNQRVAKNIDYLRTQIAAA